jgi:Flp pilus assembly protein TadG
MSFSPMTRRRTDHVTRQRFITRKLKALGSSVAGGAAVELAVMLPVLLLIAIGVSDLGRVFFTGITVANAARAGAQWGSMNPVNSANPAGMNLAATDDAADAAPITVSSRSFCRCDAGELDCLDGGDCGVAYGAYRSYVEVTVSKTVDLIFSYPGLPTSVTLSRTATFRVQ